nr:anti-sigma factor [Mucilaginibacter segetis]
MEFYAAEHAIEPSEALRNKVLNSLLINLGDDTIFTKPRKHTDEEQFEDDDHNVAQLHTGKSTNFYKYAFAACLALLVVSTFALVNLYNQLQDSNSQLTAVLQQKQQFANRVNLMDRELDMYRDPSIKVLKLEGMPKTPSSAMTVAWNPANKKVMVDMKSMKLPKYDKQHQYQLWALVAGKPVDLGVFDTANPGDDTALIKEMKPIASAEAFAVTLEPRGGSINPTMDEMVVIGKL